MPEQADKVPDRAPRAERSDTEDAATRVFAESPDDEAAEAARFAFNRSDSFHESVRWTVLTPHAHRVDILLRALEPRTHASIRLIRDPASEAPPLGLLLAARAEEDALHAAGHDNLPSYHVRCGHRSIMLLRPNIRTWQCSPSGARGQ
jgi:hypothetical protein